MRPERALIAASLLLTASSTVYAETGNATTSQTPQAGGMLGTSTTAFFIGVLVAVASFLIKEVTTDVVNAIRFRRQVVEDMKMIIESYKRHYPDLQKLKDAIQAVPKALPSFIWDSTLDGPQGLSEHAHCLTPLESSQCTRFYDELSRIGEIRTEYNLSVRGLVTEEEKRPLYTSIAVACLSDLQQHYHRVINRGCKSLLELKKNHWFLKIDESQCQEDVTSTDTAK